ncbi:hypothetical protein niasHS_003178 [Heterodera schachtii]|uniref:Uncharacterized protein n=1 Tax=Heterodera schachtii TaxID=97005 RepID=A0ABD2KH32_HETSC
MQRRDTENETVAEEARGSGTDSLPKVLPPTSFRWAANRIRPRWLLPFGRVQQCEICMAENWCRPVAYQNTFSSTTAEPNGRRHFGRHVSHRFEWLRRALQRVVRRLGFGRLHRHAHSQPATANAAEPSADDFLRADFSMPKFREFWLLDVKARLFNVFKYRSKIRDIAHQFLAQVEESEHSDGTEKPKREKKQMTN